MDEFDIFYVSDILIRLRELASQAATGTVGSTERQTIQLEFSALRNELTRIAQTTEFNGTGLIDGTLASSVTSSNHVLIQIGIDNTAHSRLDLNNEINLAAVTSTTMGINNLSVTGAVQALTSGPDGRGYAASSDAVYVLQRSDATG